MLNEANDSKFVKRKWNIGNDNSKANYGVGNEISDCNDPYILVSGDSNIIRHQGTKIAFKDCAPFSKCITKIDETIIYDAENLGLVMPMYNLIEYSSNYSEATGSLGFHSKDIETNFLMKIANTNDFKYLNSNLDGLFRIPFWGGKRV